MKVVAALGDLIDDVVVELTEPLRPATDTTSVIRRTRGGSAANTAAAVVVAGGRGRFIGNVGSDWAGDSLLSQLTSVGVDLAVNRSGRVGTVVAVIDERGERTLLTDRAASSALVTMPNGWDDNLGALHVPAYALVAEPLAGVAKTALCETASRSILTSVDVSALPVIEQYTSTKLLSDIDSWGVDVVFANQDEAVALGVIDSKSSPIGSTIIVKQGRDPAMILTPDGRAEVEADAVALVQDTVGAGDAFAAGVLVSRLDGADWIDAVRVGHRLGALAVVCNGALTGAEQ